MKINFKSDIASVLVMVLLIIMVMTSGKIRNITDVKNSNITIKFNGVKQTLKDANGNAVNPVVIDGNTYLPVRSISNTLGAGIIWDANTQTIDITTESYAPSTISTNKLTKLGNARTLKDPIKFGSTFGWLEQSNIKTFEYQSYIEMSVTNIKKITESDITAMGLKTTNDDQRLEYVLVSLNIKGKNIEPTGISKDYLDYNMTRPQIWGSQSISGMYVIGGTDYGFDGSIDRNIDSRYKSAKIYKGKSVAEIDYSGNIVLAVIRGEKNYLVMQKKNSDLDSEALKIYFELN